ncbi:dihydroxyacetone phosphate acyltransferase-like isoform X1 [Vespa mandarinia]|uniref:dihydroxyacetone phosphate acyltransferase-like isoform X1 n=1 Tax=Vespa mandarinia TaxID=7446 RepID=UPI0016193B13|nr:dihydroxyacetone phosphate acyltransferase-like isoform X1 [Vespa mandarinia]
MQQNNELIDLLEQRRKDSDFSWVSRLMKIQMPHMLPPELNLSRNQIINTVLNSPRIKEVISYLAKSQNVYTYIIERKAYAILQEMASKAHLPTVRWLGFFIIKTLKKIFCNLYINERMIFNLKKQMSSFQVQYIYVPSHRSYLDFILLSCILFNYDMSLPNIASGMDFYQMRFIGEILRKTGAFYMRRSFSNDLLYKEIFKAYVSYLVNHNDRAIEFFIEGTRSRSQKSIEPKYGFLSVILDTYLQSTVPEIQFLPISISYDRPLEEKLFVYELLGVPKPKETTTAFLQSLLMLKNHVSYGSVFFNIGEPISASQYITSKDRKTKIINPDYKLPSTIIENLAYDIIYTHQKNTILTTFNIIALLFNERVQTYPANPYTLQTLAEDYKWYKNWLLSLGATIHPSIENMTTDELYNEILVSLETHSELLTLDESKMLNLKNMYVEMKSENYTNIKGHNLNKRTMEVAVPAINLTIYVNPTLFFLAKLGIITATVGLDSIHMDKAFERYVLLRKLLSTEFALFLNASSSVINLEWKKSIDILVKEGCLYIQNDLITGQKTALFSLLHNLILPFIDAACFTCTTLLNWNESVLGTITNQKVLKECQKQVEIALFEEKNSRPHPYCLALDLFKSTLSNLLQQGIVVTSDKEDIYFVDKIQMEYLILKLHQLPLLHPLGFYSDISLSPLNTSVHIQAKL